MKLVNSKYITDKCYVILYANDKLAFVTMKKKKKRKKESIIILGFFKNTCTEEKKEIWKISAKTNFKYQYTILGYLVIEIVINIDAYGAWFMLFTRIKWINYYLFGSFNFCSTERTSQSVYFTAFLKIAYNTNNVIMMIISVYN